MEPTDNGGPDISTGRTNSYNSANSFTEPVVQR